MNYASEKLRYTEVKLTPVLILIFFGKLMLYNFINANNKTSSLY